MPKLHGAGKCSDCCFNCKCNGSPLRRLYITISNVAMNASPVIQDCFAPRFGQTIDQTWYNGVTFVFNSEFANDPTNPNNFDFTSVTTVACSNHAGTWVCPYSLPPLGEFGESFNWGISVAYATISSHFNVRVSLFCYKLSATPIPGTIVQQSSQQNTYDYDDPCPVGSYSLTTRSYAGNQNNGAFDFRNFDATLLWAA